MPVISLAGIAIAGGLRLFDLVAERRRPFLPGEKAAFVERQCERKRCGLADADEIEAGHALRPGKTLKRKLTAADVPNTLTRGSFARPARAPARFKPGDRVRTKNSHPETHTRLPRYARDRVGIIEALRGCHVFPDTAARGQGENPQWLYTVLFEGRELWGENADPTLKISIEAFEPYLEPA